MRKPLAFGNALNVSPVLLVPNLLIYQLARWARCRRSMRSMTAGVPLTWRGQAVADATRP